MAFLNKVSNMILHGIPSDTILPSNKSIINHYIQSLVAIVGIDKTTT